MLRGEEYEIVTVHLDVCGNRLPDCMLLKLRIPTHWLGYIMYSEY